MVAPAPMLVSNDAFPSTASQVSSTSISGCGFPHPTPLRLLSHPAAVLSLGLLSSPHVPAPSPYAMADVGWARRYWHGLSVLPATDQLFHSLPTAPDVLLLPQLISPVGEGSSLGWEPLCFFRVPSAPQGVEGPISLSLLLLLPLLHSVLLGHLGIFFVLSSVQGLWLVFSWSSVRIVPSVDVFLMHLWRDELDVHLFLCYLASLTLNLFSYFYCLGIDITVNIVDL